MKKSYYTPLLVLIAIIVLMIPFCDYKVTPSYIITRIAISDSLAFYKTTFIKSPKFQGYSEFPSIDSIDKYCFGDTIIITKKGDR